MIAWVETVSVPEVLGYAFGPSALAVIVFYVLRATRFSFLRLVSFAPLMPGFLVGVSMMQELSRAGVREYLGIGGKKTALYLLVMLVPVLTGAFLLWQELKTRKIESRS